MNKLLKLIRINMKDAAGRYMAQLNARGRITGKIMGLLPLLALLPAVSVTALIYDIFSKAGMGTLALTYTNVGAVILMIATAIPMIVASLFYSKDLSLLATLPLKGRTIILAKLAGIYPYLAVMGLVLFGSTGAFYLADMSFPIRDTVIIILALITLPLLPLALGTLITLPFMSLAGGRKHRNLFTVLGNILLLGAILGMEVLITRTTSNPEALVKILTAPDGLLNFIGKGYPPSIWLTKSLSGNNLQLLWYLLLQAGSALLIYLSAGKVYDRALKKYNQQESSGDKQAITYRKTNIKMLLLKRNLGIIFTNPTFLLNTVMTIFIPVILFVLYSMMGIMSLETLNSPLLAPFKAYIFFGIVISPSLIGSLSATSISREGKFFWETRVMPVRHEDSLFSRELVTLLLNGTGQLILAIAAWFLLPVDYLSLAFIIFAAVFSTLLFSRIDLIINIERPYLNWSNPTACIKNNMNVMLSLASRVVIGGLAYLVYLLTKGLGTTQVLFSIGIMSLLLYLLLTLLLKKVYLKKYEQIDAV